MQVLWRSIQERYPEQCRAVACGEEVSVSFPGSSAVFRPTDLLSSPAYATDDTEPTRHQLAADGELGRELALLQACVWSSQAWAPHHRLRYLDVVGS